MKRALVLLIIVLLAGCSTARQESKASEGKWNNDFYKCTRDSQKVISGSGESLYSRQAAVFNRCMTAQGYSGYARN